MSNAAGPRHAPFAGLRANGRALLIGTALLAGLWLLPDLTPAPTGDAPVELAQAEFLGYVVRGETPTDGPTIEFAMVRLIDGRFAGEVREAHVDGGAGGTAAPTYAPGDRVVVTISLDPGGADLAVSDRWRAPPLGALLLLFAAAVALVGGWRGVRSLLALALTLAVIVRIVLPLLLRGWDPVLLAVAAGAAITLAVVLLTEGWRPTTLAAVAGTFLALGLTAGLATLATAALAFSELQGQEAASFLASLGLEGLDVGGILLAAVVFGALGVLDDVTVTQAATVHELALSDPDAGRLVLFGRAMNVGRSHIAATVNTLVLAYVGASLPLLVLFAAGRADPLLIASGEVVAVEIARAIVGSIGIVAAVPLTTAIAVRLVPRRLS